MRSVRPPRLPRSGKLVVFAGPDEKARTVSFLKEACKYPQGLWVGENPPLFLPPDWKVDKLPLVSRVIAIEKPNFEAFSFWLLHSDQIWLVQGALVVDRTVDLWLAAFMAVADEIHFFSGRCEACQRKEGFALVQGRILCLDCYKEAGYASLVAHRG